MNDHDFNFSSVPSFMLKVFLIKKRIKNIIKINTKFQKKSPPDANDEVDFTTSDYLIYVIKSETSHNLQFEDDHEQKPGEDHENETHIFLTQTYHQIASSAVAINFLAESFPGARTIYRKCKESKINQRTWFLRLMWISFVCQCRRF